MASALRQVQRRNGVRPKSGAGTHRGQWGPAAGADRRDFRLAALVLSLDRLLNQDEMDFFEHMAARGEAREPLRYTSGFASGTTLPFFLATGRRATLTTRLR